MLGYPCHYHTRGVEKVIRVLARSEHAEAVPYAAAVRLDKRDAHIGGNV